MKEDYTKFCIDDDVWDNLTGEPLKGAPGDFRVEDKQRRGLEDLGLKLDNWRDIDFASSHGRFAPIFDIERILNLSFDDFLKIFDDEDFWPRLSRLLYKGFSFPRWVEGQNKRRKPFRSTLNMKILYHSRCIFGGEACFEKQFDPIPWFAYTDAVAKIWLQNYYNKNAKVKVLLRDVSSLLGKSYHRSVSYRGNIYAVEHAATAWADKQDDWDGFIPDEFYLSQKQIFSKETCQMMKDKIDWFKGGPKKVRFGDLRAYLSKSKEYISWGTVQELAERVEMNPDERAYFNSCIKRKFSKSERVTARKTATEKTLSFCHFFDITDGKHRDYQYLVDISKCKVPTIVMNYMGKTLSGLKSGSEAKRGVNFLLRNSKKRDEVEVDTEWLVLIVDYTLLEAVRRDRDGDLDTDQHREWLNSRAKAVIPLTDDIVDRVRNRLPSLKGILVTPSFSNRNIETVINHQEEFDKGVQK